MITTGRQVNFRLGDGDARQHELLGGSDAEIGQGFITSGTGFGARFIPTRRDVILRAAQAASSAGATTGGNIGGGGGGRPVYDNRSNRNFGR